MREVAAQNFIGDAVREYGTEGSQRVRAILETVARIFAKRDPENIRGSVVIFSTLRGKASQSPDSVPQVYFSMDSFAQNFSTPILVQVLDDGELKVWFGDSVDPLDLSQTAIVYKYENRTDTFFIAGRTFPIPKLYPASASQFAQPRYRNLAEALERYKVQMVRHSRCRIFSQSWLDKRRLFFKPHPEHFMRESLEAFLVSALSAEAEVRPEHNVDERHPVDIRVFWNLGNQEALIEIKWLGASKAGRRVTTRYTQSRALEGASQLAGYLDSNKPRAGATETRGTLIVFDARRDVPSSGHPTRDQAFKYEHSEIVYDPDYTRERLDFDRPHRLYAEPDL